MDDYRSCFQRPKNAIRQYAENYSRIVNSATNCTTRPTVGNANFIFLLAQLNRTNNFVEAWNKKLAGVVCFFFFFSLLHPKPLERSHASKAKSCPTTKGNCSSIANADQRRRVSHLSQWGEDFVSPPPATFSAFGIESIPHHRVCW